MRTFLRLLPLSLAALAALAAPPTSFPLDNALSEWKIWSPRAEIAPAGEVDAACYRTAPDALRLTGNGDTAVYGGWQRAVGRIEPGAWYRFTAWRRTAGMARPPMQTAARLGWLTAAGIKAGEPDYARPGRSDGEWVEVIAEAPAPEGAGQAVLELFLANSAQGRVWWDDVRFEKIDPPAARRVNIVSVNLRPRNTGSPEASVERFAALIEKEVPLDADLIVLPEGITVVGTGRTYAAVAESVPGPTTRRLGELARAKRAYIAAGIYEREGAAVYNVAVLLDRTGALVGKYRKVYLPREEFEGGITPGSDYPVFATDFGKVGLMICWDVQYADPARALALRGAEMILMPIWGGNETLAAARAIENHVFLVASGYDHPTYVMDPMGEILSKAPEDGSIAEAVVDLNRRYTWPWLGEMTGRYFHEIRSDVEVDPR